MRETELGDQQVFKKRQRRRASGERRELGAKKVPWRVPGWPGSAGQKGDQDPTSKVRSSGCTLLEEPLRDTPCPRYEKPK